MAIGKGGSRRLHPVHVGSELGPSRATKATSNARLPGYASSVAYDRGSEMACLSELVCNLIIDIRFPAPEVRWQHGPNANTNGLQRQFMPIGTYISYASLTLASLSCVTGDAVPAIGAGSSG